MTAADEAQRLLSLVGHDTDDDDGNDDEGSVSIPDSFEDAHVAEALADHLRGSWLYVAGANRWHRWDGRRWAHDTTEQVYEVARQWILELSTQLFRDGASPDDLNRAARYRNEGKLESALTMARRIEGIAATVAGFDRDPDILNVANGVVDLRTGALGPHDPSLRLSKLAEVNYNPDAHHDDVDDLLAVVDPEVLPYLQRLFGYATTGHTLEDVVPIADGAGANGKSTFLEAVASVLGDYAGAVSPQLVMRTAHDQHPTVKADLMGKRLVWISETEEGGAFRMEAVKALTGGDQISARFMRGDFFVFTPTHTLVIATNHRPKVNTTEHAAWRRLRLIPFPFTYHKAHEASPGDRVQDPRLRHRLVTGAPQREALLAWLVVGAVGWNRQGLGTSEAVDTATNAWRRSEDVLHRFIDDILVLGKGGRTKGRQLYTSYVDWCAVEGRKAKSNKNFAEEFMNHEVVIEASVKKITPQNIAVYEEVMVRDDAS